MPQRILAAYAILSCFAHLAPADTITVCTQGCDYTRIQDAIDAATDQDIIQLEDQIYYEGHQIDTRGKAITIRGAKYGGLIRSVINGNGAHRIFICQSGEGRDTILEDLVLQNGAATEAEAVNKTVLGGGILLLNSSPTIRNCIFRDNQAMEKGFYGGRCGGAIFADESSNPVITDCQFLGNIAGVAGGAICASSDLVITRTTFESNQAITSTGGAISGGILTLSECSFIGNFAGYGGSAIRSNVEIATDCIFEANLSDGVGGAIYLYNESAKLLACRFRGNTANEFADIYGSPAGTGTLELEDCVFCESSPRPIYSDWSGQRNHFAFDCQDLNGNGVPDECEPSQPATRRVPSEYASIDAAVRSSRSGDTIIIAAGTYQPDSPINPLGKTIAITGEVDSMGNPVSIIDGGGSLSLFEFFTHETEETTISNLVIRNGLGSNNGGFFSTGGGVSSAWSSPTIENCIFRDNNSNYGGGVFAFYSGITFDSCQFAGNSASNDGGGIYLYESTSEIEGCLFQDNSAFFNGGGAITLYRRTNAAIADCSFEENHSDFLGGAILISQSEGSLSACRFENNYSLLDGSALAITSLSKTVQLNKCVFLANEPSAGASVLLYGDASLRFIGESFFEDCCQIVPPRSFTDLGGNDYDSWCDDCRADLDCRNRGVDAEDLGYLLERWNSAEIQADIDGDGIVGPSDLGLLFSQWGPCT